MPDISYRVNDPGMSAVWCVLPALKAAIATGVVDPKRVGLQGHSWGGYQTSFLVTQTDMFAAAVAGAPLTNMISMYSLIYKNTGGDQPGDLREQPGPVHRRLLGQLGRLHAQLAGLLREERQDAAHHPAQRPGRRRRLHAGRRVLQHAAAARQKPVVLLEYPGENHGLAKPANQQDYTVRMKEFFDHHLMGKPAPDWWTKGVSRLDMEEHIKQRLESAEEEGGTRKRRRRK